MKPNYKTVLKLKCFEVAARSVIFNTLTHTHPVWWWVWSHTVWSEIIWGQTFWFKLENSSEGFSLVVQLTFELLFSNYGYMRKLHYCGLRLSKKLDRKKPVMWVFSNLFRHMRSRVPDVSHQTRPAAPAELVNSEPPAALILYGTRSLQHWGWMTSVPEAQAMI